MTLPMHDAGSTTPDPGPTSPAARSRRGRTNRHGRTNPGQELWPEEPEPGDRTPRAGAARRPDPLPPMRARCRAAARARPRRRSRWRSSGPPRRQPAPFAFAGPPARPALRPAGAGCPGHRLPAAWSRPAAPPAAHLHADCRTSRRERPGPQDQPAARSPAAAPGGRKGRLERAPATRGPRHLPSAPAWSGPPPAWRSAPWSPGHRLPAHPRAGVRVRHQRARQRVQQFQHAAELGLLPDARRHLHQRGRAAAGPGGPARPGPRRGLRAAGVQPGRAGPVGGHRAGDAAGRPLVDLYAPPSTAPSTT